MSALRLLAGAGPRGSPRAGARASIGGLGSAPTSGPCPAGCVRLPHGRRAEVVPLCCGSARPAVPGPRPAPPACPPPWSPAPTAPPPSAPLTSTRAGSARRAACGPARPCRCRWSSCSTISARGTRISLSSAGTTAGPGPRLRAPAAALSPDRPLPAARSQPGLLLTRSQPRPPLFLPDPCLAPFSSGRPPPPGRLCPRPSPCKTVRSSGELGQCPPATPSPPCIPSPWAGGRRFGRSSWAGREPESALAPRAELHVSVPDTSEQGP